MQSVVKIDQFCQALAYWIARSSRGEMVSYFTEPVFMGRSALYGSDSYSVWTLQYIT